MAGKTAAGVLQELAVKAGTTPEYECVSKTGPEHLALFEIHCAAFGLKATGIALSKKVAKQEAAQALLLEMTRAGHKVPAPFCLPRGPAPAGATPQPDAAAREQLQSTNTYVALLKEYCAEYRLPAPEDTLIGDSGPPHHRSFTVRVSVGAHSRDATALSKKAARQSASEAIYKYLRGCLKSTQDFVEKDALARNVFKNMTREEKVQGNENEPWRPPLDQKISEFQCGLVLQFNEEKRASAMEALRSTAAANQPPSVQLECATAALGIEPTWGTLPSTTDTPLVIVELADTSPSLLYIGYDRDDAAAHMVRYLNRCLMNPPRDPLLVFQEERERRERDAENAQSILD